MIMMKLILIVHADRKAEIFRTALWNFLTKQVLGHYSAKNVGDGYEIARVVDNPGAVSLGERVIYLHNNDLVRGLSLDTSFGNVITEIGKIAGLSLVRCIADAFDDCLELLGDVTNIDILGCEYKIHCLCRHFLPSLLQIAYSTLQLCGQYYQYALLSIPFQISGEICFK